MITMILAIDENNLVGCSSSKYGLPWHYPEDLQYYKNNTINKINIVGRKTFYKMGGALKNRTTIVLSRDENLSIDGIEVINDIKSVNHYDEIMLIGGVEIFKNTFDIVDKILLTRIHKTHKGDVYYDLNLDQFDMVSSKIGNDQRLEFQVWERK